MEKIKLGKATESLGRTGVRAVKGAGKAVEKTVKGAGHTAGKTVKGLKRKDKEDKPSPKGSGKKLKTVAAAAIVAAGVGVNQQFTAEELVQGLPESSTAPAVIEQAVIETEPVVAELPEEERMSRGDQIRCAFLRLPMALRAAVLLPLWAIGALPAALLAPALGPLARALGSFGLQLALLTGLFCLVYKLLFPHHKVRELFRKKNLRWLFLGALLVTAADVLLAQVWSGWPLARALALAAVGLGVLWLLWSRLCGALRPPEPDTVRTRLVLDKIPAAR